MGRPQGWRLSVCIAGLLALFPVCANGGQVRLVPRGQGFDMVLARGAKRVKVDEGNGSAQTLAGAHVTYRAKHFFRRGQPNAFATINHYPDESIFTLGLRVGVKYDPRSHRGFLLDGARERTFGDLKSLLRAANRLLGRSR
jgi:hypothetical protein